MAIRRLGFALVFAAPLVLAASADLQSAHAATDATCPRAGTLGVSRTVEIDTTGGPGFGMEHYKAYDFLQDKEVVLTFDDGPQKYTTEAVLKALADECTKATFFSIGMMALGYPEIIREVAKAGHTIGTHTWSHKAIGKLKTFDEGKDEIERGFSAVHRAVGGPIAPFFRFPTLVDTPEAVAYLGKRNIAMFSADIDSFDFKPQTPEHLIKSLMAKLDKRGKGILLMHDIHKTTAKALPVLLADLKAKGYKIVHLTAKAPVATLADYDQAIEKDAKGLPQVGAERPMSSIVKTVGGPSPGGDAHAAGSGNGSAEPDGMPSAPAAEDTATDPAAATPSLPAFPSATSASAPPAKSAPPAPSAAPGKQSSDDAAKAPAESSAMAAPATPSASATAASSPAADASSTAAPEPAAKVVDTAPSGAAGNPVTTSSVVRTISGEGAGAKPADEPAAGAEAHEPSKSFTERIKETWHLWFGE